MLMTLFRDFFFVDKQLKENFVSFFYSSSLLSISIFYNYLKDQGKSEPYYLY